MNLKYNLGLIALGLLSSTLSQAAEGCGVIRINEQESNSYLRIIELDNKLLGMKNNNPSEHFSIQLQEGLRSLHIVKANSKTKETLKYGANKLLNSQDVEHKYIAIDVKKDNQYTISFDNEAGKLTLTTENNIICEGNGYTLNNNSNLSSVAFEGLPVALQSRLKVLSYQLSQIEPDINGYIQAAMYTSMGIAVDSEYAEKGYIKILSVLPGSTGFELGLRANDKLIKFNGIKIRPWRGTPNEQLSNLIYGSITEAPLSVRVQRNGENILLRSETLTPFIPSSWFFASKNSEKYGVLNKFSSHELQLFYSQTIYLIHNYLIKSRRSYELVSIQVPKQPLPILGLTGSIVPSQGALLNSVDNGSYWAGFGLQKDDVITRVGHERTSVTELIVLKSYMQNLRTGDDVLVFVSRKGREMALTGKFEQYFSPQFTVGIDMGSTQKIAQRVALQRSAGHSNGRQFIKYTDRVYSGKKVHVN